MIEDSLKILAQALNAANKAGVYNLQDSAMVAQALQNINVFVDTNTPQEDKKEEVITKKAK